MKQPIVKEESPYHGRWYTIIPQIIVLSSIEFACIVVVTAAFLILFGTTLKWRAVGGFLLTLQVFCVAIPISPTPPEFGKKSVLP